MNKNKIQETVLCSQMRSIYSGIKYFMKYYKFYEVGLITGFDCRVSLKNF